MCGQLHTIKNENELAEKKKDILAYFIKVVNQEQDLSGLLSSYFESRGFDKNFKFKIIINDLEMIDVDTIVVYKSQNYSNLKAPEGGRKNSP